MSITLVYTGTYDMDATGWPLGGQQTLPAPNPSACVIWNQNFASLFPAGVTPLVINVSTAVNNMQGDTAYTIFTKCNANFAYLFAAAGIAGEQEIVNVGSGPYNGVIGLGDTGVIACIKVNNNFELLVTQVSPINPYAWTTDSGAIWTTDAGDEWTIDGNLPTAGNWSTDAGDIWLTDAGTNWTTA